MANNELLTYRREVPEDVREAIKRRILEASANNYDEFIAVSQYLLAELAAGNISPGIASECRSLLELIMTAITAKGIVAKSGAATTTNIAKDLERARRKAKDSKPRFEITDYGDNTELEVSLAGLREKTTVEVDR